MDLATGAMKSLLPKLGELLKEEYKLQASVEGDVQYLQRELQSMHAALGSMAEVPWDQLAVQDRLWAGDVRELSHDIEDILDSFLVSEEVSKPPASTDCFTWLMAAMSNLFKKGTARHEIGTAIKEVKDLVYEVANRDSRYRGRGADVVPTATRRTTTSIDPLLSVLYENQKMVGVDDARDKVVKMLSEGDDVSNQKLRTVSIVGFGGLGKTTLAKAVYDTLREEFDCGAFVSVSRNPDMRKVFKDILYELDKEKYEILNPAALDERQLIRQLRESLGTKRYFIIIDDLWDTNTWETIKFVLLDSSCGSRIITTTRNVNISKACCSFDDALVHKMEPLSEGNSKRLFYKRIFASETGCPVQLEEVSRDILKKCGGVPLAIISLASYLSNNQQIKSESEWHLLLRSIGRGVTNGGSVEQMKKILAYSYYDLSPRLKTCFLYLSVFPEDCQINKDRLIRRWIAEGFLEGEKHEHMFELGESILNELINRSMVHPINIDANGRAEACSLHDIMLDLICDLSSKENFVHILDVIYEDTPFERKIRRLSLQKTMAKINTTRLASMRMSKVRSLTIFSPAADQMLPLLRFKFLRVLDVEGCDLREKQHVNLMCVSNLLHLRYLGLRNTHLPEIPADIGNLLFLQMLDLRGVDARELPSSAVQLRNLIYLGVRSNMLLPEGFRIFTSLQELTGVMFREEGVVLEELGYLTELRVLGFRWKPIPHGNGSPSLVQTLGKLQKLQSLEIFFSAGSDVNDLMQDWVPPPHLRRLSFRRYFQSLPTWISSSSLPLISYLKIHVRDVRLKHIQILGTLPALCHLHLQSVGSMGFTAGERLFMLSADAFPRVTQCMFVDLTLVPFMFTRGAMPMVRELRFDLSISDILDYDLDLSIRNLSSLEQVSIYIRGWRYNSDPEAALRRAAADHPNRRLKLHIRRCR